MNKTLYSQFLNWLFFAVILLNINSIFAQTKEDELINYAIKDHKIVLGGGVSLFTYSNTYSINDLIQGEFIKPNLRQDKLMAIGVGRVETFVGIDNCQIGLEHTWMAVATANKQALEFYSQYQSNGLSTSSATNYSTELNMVYLNGRGLNFGCGVSFRKYLNTSFTVRHINISDFIQRNYQGTLISTNVGSSILATETWKAMNAQTPELQQQASGGNSNSLDFNLSYRNPEDSLFGNIKVINLLSQVNLYSAPYQTRNFNATVNTGGIFQNGQILPLVGTYGNQNTTIQLPRIWFLESGYQLNKKIDIGLLVNGVDSIYQPIAFTNWRCSSCGIGQGIRLMMASDLSTIALGFSSNRWDVYVGTFLTSGTPHTNTVNEFRINIRF